MAEHRNLTGASLHEPKGAENAALDTVYTSDGAGSGAWIPIRLPGEAAATEDQVYVANGVGSGSWQSILDTPLARISIANASVPIAVTAGGIHTPASYVSITPNMASDFSLGGLTTDPVTKEFVIAEPGIYRVTSWMSISAALPSTQIGFDLLVNGIQGGTASSVVTTKLKDANEIIAITGFGIGSFTAGQKIGLGIASDTTTTITMYEGVFDIERLRS